MNWNELNIRIWWTYDNIEALAFTNCFHKLHIFLTPLSMWASSGYHLSIEFKSSSSTRNFTDSIMTHKLSVDLVSSVIRLVQTNNVHTLRHEIRVQHYMACDELKELTDHLKINAYFELLLLLFFLNHKLCSSDSCICSQQLNTVINSIRNYKPHT